MTESEVLIHAKQLIKTSQSINTFVYDDPKK